VSEYQLFEFLISNAKGAGALGVVVLYLVLTTRQRQRREADTKAKKRAKKAEVAREHTTYLERLDRIVEVVESMKADADRAKIEKAAVEAYIDREVNKRLVARSATTTPATPKGAKDDK